MPKPKGKLIRDDGVIGALLPGYAVEPGHALALPHALAITHAC
jgi:hypothetical protein